MTSAVPAVMERMTRKKADIVGSPPLLCILVFVLVRAQTNGRGHDQKMVKAEHFGVKPGMRHHIGQEAHKVHNC